MSSQSTGRQWTSSHSKAARLWKSPRTPLVWHLFLVLAVGLLVVLSPAPAPAVSQRRINSWVASRKSHLSLPHLPTFPFPRFILSATQRMTCDVIPTVLPLWKSWGKHLQTTRLKTPPSTLGPTVPWASPGLSWLSLVNNPQLLQRVFEMWIMWKSESRKLPNANSSD
jgi:hypothetical protein